MENIRDNDIRILMALYDGTHLNDTERERAYKLLYLFGKELKRR